MPFYRELTSRQEFSKRLFGRADRLEVWEAVLALDSPEFQIVDLQTRLKEESGIPETCTGSEIRVMRDVGMVGMMPRTPESPYPLSYRIDGSPLWEVAALAIQTLDKMFPCSETE